MKNSLLLIALLVTLSATAQQPRLRLLTPKEKKAYQLPSMLSQPKLLPDTTIDQYRKLLDAYQSQAALMPLARYSHTTSRGKVYSLPFDNMPCLVPDMKQVAPMPGAVMAHPFPESRMPNAIPRSPIIPKEEKGSR